MPSAFKQQAVTWGNAIVAGGVMTKIATGAIRTVTAAHDGMIVTGTVTAALVAMTAEMTEIVTVALAATTVEMTAEMGAETAETTGGGGTIGVRTMR